jgi:hypothetical protein
VCTLCEDHIAQARAEKLKKAKEEREKREKEKDKIRAIVGQRLERDKIILHAFESLTAPKRETPKSYKL